MEETSMNNLKHMCHEKINEIGLIWKAIGADDGKFKSRYDTLYDHVNVFFSQIIDEENVNLEKLHESVGKLEKHIIYLCEELHESSHEFDHNRLYEKEKLLLCERDRLNAIKLKRLSQLEKLLKKERYLSSRLCIKVQIHSRSKVPSEHELSELNLYINRLDNLKESRIQILEQHQANISKLLRELGKDISNNVFLNAILGPKALEVVSLADSSMRDCETNKDALELELKNNETTCLDLRKRFNQLENMIYSPVDHDVDDYHSLECQDFTYDTIRMLKEDISGLEAIRLAQMDALVKKSQTKLSKILANCLSAHLAGTEPYNTILESHDNSEDLLTTLENEINVWELRQEHVVILLADLESWLLITNNITALQEKLKDPEVMKNRGGILLKTQKELRDTKKEFSRTEARLKTRMATLTEQGLDVNNMYVQGTPIPEYLIMERAKLDADKENDKNSMSSSTQNLSKLNISSHPKPTVSVSSFKKPINTIKSSSRHKIPMKGRMASPIQKSALKPDNSPKSRSHLNLSFNEDDPTYGGYHEKTPTNSKRVFKK